MKSQITKTIEIHLILNQKEAEILKGLMQNPKIIEEPHDTRKLRKDVFETLKSYLDQ